MIRSLALKSIFVSNGEYCSLGLSRPSRIYTTLPQQEVFNSEIKLLQSAFNEMRSIYKPQIEANLQNKTEIKDDFITVKDFTVLMKRYNKTEKEIKSIIFEAIKKSDKRFIYNKAEKKLLILNSDFLDLV